MDSYSRNWPTFLAGKAIVDKSVSFISPSGFHNFIVPLKINPYIPGVKDTDVSRLDTQEPLAYIILGPVILVMRRSKQDYQKLADELKVGIDTTL